MCCDGTGSPDVERACGTTEGRRKGRDCTRSTWVGGRGPPRRTPRRVYDSSAADYLDFVGTDLSRRPRTCRSRDPRRVHPHAPIRWGRGGRSPTWGVGPVGPPPHRTGAPRRRRCGRVVGAADRARGAHPNVPFTQGRLDELPLPTLRSPGWCAGTRSSTRHRCSSRDPSASRRRTVPGGLVVLAYHAGSGEALARTNAHSTGMTLTTYLHHVDHLNGRLDAAGFDVHASAVRSPALPHETAQQAFVIARRR